MCNGTLRDFIKQNNDKVALFVSISRIFRGINYLHSNSLIHRDLKPENILIDHDFLCFLGDFETIRPIDDTSETQNNITSDIGSFNYASPEQLQNGKISFPTDIYSFALIIYFILNGKDFKQNRLEKIDLVKGTENIIEIFNSCSKEVQDERMKSDEILEKFIDDFEKFDDFEQLSQQSISVITEFFIQNLCFISQQKEKENGICRYLVNVHHFLLVFLDRKMEIINNKIEQIIADLFYSFGEDQLAPNEDIQRVIIYLSIAEKLGHNYASLELGCLYLGGVLGEIDIKKAKKHLKKAAEKNVEYSHYFLGILYSIQGNGNKANFVKAKKHFESEKSCQYLADYFLQNYQVLDIDFFRYCQTKMFYNFDSSLDTGMLSLMNAKTEQEFYDAKKDFKSSTNPMASLFINMFCKEQCDNELFIKFSELQAEQNDSKSLNILGNLYLNGLGVEQDYSKAKYYFELAAKQNDSKSLNNLGVLYYNGLGVEQDYSMAKYYFELAAKQNDSDALNILGNLYLNGLGVEQDYSMAKYYFELAAKQNDSKSLNILGVLYLNGLGVEQDYSMAKYYFELAAKQNDSESLSILGNLYLNGLGVERDYSMAKYYFELAAKQNDSKSLNILGNLYLNGLGVERDYSMAKYYFELAAKQNDSDALNILGNLYLNGLGVERDYSMAKYYYELAVKQNDSDALNNLGDLYLNGLGVEQDLSKAKDSSKLSVKQNESNALNILEILHKLGFGVGHDYSKAKYYYELSAKQNNPSALILLGILEFKDNYFTTKYYFELAAKQNHPFGVFFRKYVYIYGGNERHIKSNSIFIEMLQY
ncbi:hypothetical protein M9Y10_021284 [Tritrichomonas musculus]|uniref:Protein kinase domain-containing protein n=1 Tax=Tritrichomonas musculus TaxID=1915356 RepID=A0ABR2HDL6_9EUKA